MEFETLYDIQQAGCRYGFVPIVLLGVLVIALATGRRSTHPLAMALFFAILTAIAYLATWHEYFSLLRGMQAGQAATMTGAVHDFQAAANEKAPESFAVDGQTFTYRNFATKQGFHTLRMDGNPLVDGATVRVTYVGDHILRLEVAARGQ